MRHLKPNKKRSIVRAHTVPIKRIHWHHPRSIKYETAVLIFKVENIIICSSVSRVGWTSGVSLGLSCAYTHHEPMRPTAVATVYVSCQSCESPSEKFLSVCTRRSMIVLCLDWPGDYIRLPSIRTQRATVCGPLIYTRNFVYFIWSEKHLEKKNSKIQRFIQVQAKKKFISEALTLCWCTSSLR